ncbi:MAG: PH domain-containing protein [Candidatus Uhrbacteria bacterium]
MKENNLIKLRPNEQILDVVREDFIPTLPWWIFLFVWIAAPFFFLVPLVRQGMVGIIFLVVMAGTGIVMAFRTHFSWRKTALVVTDERSVDITQHGFFDRTTTEVEHKNIQEVTFYIKGLLATVFRFGTVYLRTAGNAADIAVRRVHRPIDLHHLLNDLKKEAQNDPVVIGRAQKLKSLADRLSDVEVERLAAAVGKRERETASQEFFQK